MQSNSLRSVVASQGPGMMLSSSVGKDGSWVAESERREAKVGRCADAEEAGESSQTKYGGHDVMRVRHKGDTADGDPDCCEELVTEEKTFIPIH